MSNDSLVAIVVSLIVLGAGLLTWYAIQRRRTRALRDRFGPEYEQAVDTFGGPRRAERELATRERRVQTFNIRTLTPEQHQRFSVAWQDAQTHFVDNPSRAVDEADGLVKDLLQTRGYPISDFEQRAADISVDHPHVVSHYRAARDIAVANRQGRSNTEDLRQAMVHYRSLFEELLEVSPPLRQVGVR